MSPAAEKLAKEFPELMAGTGFMPSLSDGINRYMKMGYTENFMLKIDHLESGSGKNKIYPYEIEIDAMVRFENTSDPDDQSILYAISSPSKKLKGLYVDSYGVYHEEVSEEMLTALREKPATK